VSRLSAIDREDCLAANSKSMGPQEQNTDDRNQGRIQEFSLA